MADDENVAINHTVNCLREFKLIPIFSTYYKRTWETSQF